MPIIRSQPVYSDLECILSVPVEFTLFYSHICFSAVTGRIVPVKEYFSNYVDIFLYLFSFLNFYFSLYVYNVTVDNIVLTFLII